MSLLTNTTGDISTMVAELLFVLCKENVGRYLISETVDQHSNVNNIQQLWIQFHETNMKFNSLL